MTRCFPDWIPEYLRDSVILDWLFDLGTDLLTDWLLSVKLIDD